MSGPSSVWRAKDGSLYIADTGNHRIRHISKKRATITTIAGTGVASFNGDGAAISRNLNTPTSVVVDEDGKIRAEPLGFPAPVLEQGGRAYDERGLGKALFLAQRGEKA